MTAPGMDADAAAYERGEPVTHGALTVQQVDEDRVRVTISGRTWVVTWGELVAALDKVAR